MGTDLVPRLRRMDRYSLHYSAGGIDDLADLLLFVGASGSLLRAVNCNYGYVRKRDALRLAERLGRLRARLKKADARQVIRRRRYLSKDELERFLLVVGRDIGCPEPPPGLVGRLVRQFRYDFWCWDFDLSHMILLCRKGGGFWWS